MSHHYERQTRTACIIDGDNIARGGELTIKELATVAGCLHDAMRNLPVTFAMQRKLATTYMPAYASLGWGIRFASMAPDAADLELLDAATEYIEHGVTTLFVVSGDHAFADLAAKANLHVCTYRRSLSRRLRLAATTVTYLDGLLPAAAA